MITLIKKALKIEGEEGAYLLWMLFLGLFLGSATTLYLLNSLANFLDVFDYSYIPGALICSGIAGIFISNTYISIQNWVSYRRVAIVSMILQLIIFAFTFLYYRITPSHFIVYFAFVLTGPVTALTLHIFWGLFEQFYDLAQAKRLAVKVEAGFTGAAVIVASLIALKVYPPVFHSPNALYLLASFLMLVGFFVLAGICGTYEFLGKITVNVQYIKAFNNYNKLIKQPYIIQLALFSLLSGIAVILVEYSFLRFINVQYASQHQTLSFLAGFLAVIFGAGFIVQALVLNWLSEKYGLLVTLLVTPVVVGIFVAIYAVLGNINGYAQANSVYFFIFMLVCISRALHYTFYKAIEIPTFKLFFLPLDQMLRADIQGKIERVIKEAAKVLAGGLILLFLNYLSFEFFPYLVLAIFSAWGFIGYKMNMGYREKLRLSLDQQQIDSIEKKEKVASGLLAELLSVIPVSDPEKVKVYLGILKRLDPISYKTCLLDLLYSDNDELQKIALLETSMFSLLPAIPVLENIQASKFYPVLKNRDLIDKVCIQLKGAQFRLKKIKYVDQLTISKIRKERIFGALLAAYVDSDYKPRLLNKLFRDRDKLVRYMAVASAVHSDNADLQKNLIEKLGEPEYGNAAVSSVTDTGESFIPALINAFYMTGQEEKIQLRIVQALARMGTETAIEHLVKMLSYKNQNVVHAAFEAISSSGFNIKGDKALTFKAELEEYVSVMIWNMSVYSDLTRHAASPLLISAVKAEIESNFNVIFKILSLLFEPKTIALIQKNIFSNDAEKSEYAAELLEVVLTEELKPILVPVLNTASYEEKVDKMQGQFPSEPMEKHQILVDLVQRDYKYVNRWTKACALKELSEENNDDNHEIYLANIVNPDPLLSETAAVALYIKNPELFLLSCERFKNLINQDFAKEIEEKIPYGSDEEAFKAPSLQFEIIKFLNSVHQLQYVPGIILTKVAKISQYRLIQKGEIINSSYQAEALSYLIIRTGEVGVYRNGELQQTYQQGALVHNYNFISDYSSYLEIKAESDCEVYSINQEAFNEVMSFYEEIGMSIVRELKQGSSEAVAGQIFNNYFPASISGEQGDASKAEEKEGKKIEAEYEQAV